LLVLLPPSEGKSAPQRGKPVDLGKLAFADELGAARRTVLDALGLPELESASAARASAVYTGVLYQHLQLAALPAPARKRVLIFSALWGVVRPDDRIPRYKLPAAEKVPALGSGLPAFWRPVLRDVLADAGLVVDLRSGSYTSFWAPRDAQVVSVRAFTEHAGERKVVSHMVKATRGDVARIVLTAPRRPRTAEAVADLVAAAGHRVELTPTRAGASLDVIA